MSLKAILEEAEKYANEAIEKPARLADGLEFPEESGVYLIYKNEEVVYIGQSTNLKKRFGKHLSASKSPRGSTFRRILIRKCGMEPQNTRGYIMENCSISFIEVDDSDMCRLVESLLISYFRIKNNEENESVSHNM